MGEMWEQLTIKTDVQRRDGLSCFLNNCVLENVIWKWWEKQIKSINETDLVTLIRGINTAQK